MHRLIELVKATLPRPRLPIYASSKYVVEFASDLVEFRLWHGEVPYCIHMMTGRFEDDRALEYQARAIVSSIERHFANKEPSGPSCPIPEWNQLLYPNQPQRLWDSKRYFDWIPYAHT